MREFPADSGRCDYLLFVGGKPAGVIEAKRQGVVLTSIEPRPATTPASLPD